MPMIVVNAHVASIKETQFPFFNSSAGDVLKEPWDQFSQV